MCRGGTHSEGFGLGNDRRHRGTGRFEAHLWDKTGWNQKQHKKGKQGVR